MSPNPSENPGAQRPAAPCVAAEVALLSELTGLALRTLCRQTFPPPLEPFVKTSELEASSHGQSSAAPSREKGKPSVILTSLLRDAACCAEAPMFGAALQPSSGRMAERMSDNAQPASATTLCGVPQRGELGRILAEKM